MPIYRRSLVLLAKVETTYGTDPTPTGAANAMRVRNVKINPMEGQDLPRDLDLPAMANQGTIPADLHMKLEFEAELAPSGAAGTPPAFGPLLRGCGMAQTIAAGVSVTYNPVTNNHESLTFYFQLGGTLWKIKGARGTVKLQCAAQKIPVLAFSFLGLWEAPSDVAAPTPVFTAWQKPVIVSNTNTPIFTVNGTSLVLKDYSLDLGVKLEPRFLVGSHSIEITDRGEMLDMRVEAVPMATFNPFTLANLMTEVPIVLAHGLGAGKITTITTPLAQLQRLSGLEDSQGIVEWPLKAAPQMNAGNDQFTIVFT